MGRKKINDEVVTGRFREGTIKRISNLLIPPEKQADFVRKAVETEIDRRIDLFQMAQQIAAGMPREPDKLEEMIELLKIQPAPRRFKELLIKFDPVHEKGVVVTDEEYRSRQASGKMLADLLNKAEEAKSAKKPDKSNG